MAELQGGGHSMSEAPNDVVPREGDQQEQDNLEHDDAASEGSIDVGIALGISDEVANGSEVPQPPGNPSELLFPNEMRIPDPVPTDADVLTKTGAKRANVPPKESWWKRKVVRPSLAALRRIQGKGEPEPPTAGFTCLQYLLLFLTVDILKKIVEETNKYAHSLLAKSKPAGSNLKTWPPQFVKTFLKKPFGLSELATWLAITYLMGVRSLPAIPDYWSTQRYFGDPWVKMMGMSRERYKGIKSVLHLCTDGEEGDAPRKLGSVYTDFQAALKGCKELGLNLSLDEMMIRFEGNLKFVHRKQNKPTSEGMKMYAICEAKTGYVYAFILDMRAGKTIRDFVMELVEELPNTGHHIYMDNLFISYDTLVQLKEKGFFACGTARSGALSGFPPQLQEKTKNKPQGLKLPKRGNWAWLWAGPGVLATAWQDVGHTAFMSTIHPPEEGSVPRRVPGHAQRQDVPAPTTAVDYNENMGGVDQADSQRASYSCQQVSMKWWHAIWFFMMDVAMCDAYAMYCEVEEKAKRKPLPKKNFIVQVVDELHRWSGDPEEVNPHTPEPSTPMDDTIDAPRTRTNSLTDLGELPPGDHYPIACNRLRCVVCHKMKRETKVNIKCGDCGVVLCLEHYGPFHKRTVETPLKKPKKSLGRKAWDKARKAGKVLWPGEKPKKRKRRT